MQNTENKSASKKDIGIISAFALSVGTSIGWGSFVVTGSSFLKNAGLMGSIIAIIIGFLLMAVIGYCYHYMMNKTPDNGGLYTYIKKTFGPDHAFLASWFIIIIYLAILWANLTSIALFSRFIFGDIFQFGFHYSIKGYDIYLGEILLTFLFLIVTGSLTLLRIRIKGIIQSILVILFVGIIIFTSFYVMIAHGNTNFTYNPLFLEDQNGFTQIISVLTMMPWAYIGFESISHSTKDFNFKGRKILYVILISLFISTLVYIFMCVISASTYGDNYPNWLAYIADSGNLSGYDGIPAFYASKYYLGTFGVVISAIALFSIITTSVIGNTLAASNLIQKISEDGILIKWFSKKNKNDVPVNAVLTVLLSSTLIIFIGKVAIGWIVDVNNICGVVLYFYIGLATLKTGLHAKDKKGIIFGILASVIAAFFGLIHIIISFSGNENGIANEALVAFIVWSLLGIIIFIIVLRNNKNDVYGRSAVVWIFLSLLIFLTTTLWAFNNLQSVNKELVDNINNYVKVHGTIDTEALNKFDTEAIKKDTFYIIMLLVIVLITQAITFTVLVLGKLKEKKNRHQLNKMTYMATRDALTGVKNKAAYNLVIEELQTKIQYGEISEFAVITCDINDLKYMNDKFGHDFGDKYIKDAAKMMCEIFIHSPVFRVGGDEFVILLEDSDYKNKAALFSKLRNSAWKNSQEETGVVISSGISIFNPNVDFDYTEVFRRADQEMYINKNELKGNRPFKSIR